jgi:hypothetical protein
MADKKLRRFRGPPSERKPDIALEHQRKNAALVLAS